MRSQKGCPFCHEHVIQIVKTTPPAIEGLQAECDCCGARGPIYGNKKAAIDSWEYGTPNFYEGKGHRES